MSGVMFGSYETSRQAVTIDNNAELEAIQAFQNVERLLRSSGTQNYWKLIKFFLWIRNRRRQNFPYIYYW